MKIDNREYMFYSPVNNISKIGDIETVAQFMVDSVGLLDDEIDSALIDMQLRSNNVAEFNGDGKFALSTKIAKGGHS